MTILTITNDQIINGLSPELPEGITEIIIGNCYDLEVISNIPASVRKIKLSFLPNLRTIPELSEGVEEITIYKCSALETIPNIPASVKKIKLLNLKNLKALSKFPEGVEEIIIQDSYSLEAIPDILASVKKIELVSLITLKKLPNFLEGIEEIIITNCRHLETHPNIPTSVKKIDLDQFKKLKTLPELHEGIEEIKLYDCDVLDTITNIPASIRKIDLSFLPKLKTLPELHEGVKEIIIQNCSALETITNIPTSVTKVDLTDCLRLILTPELLERLQLIKENNGEVTYPSHFNNLLSEETRSRFNSLLDSYKAQNPAAEIRNIQTLIHRFLGEDFEKRGGIFILTSTLYPALTALEKNINLLPLFDEIAGIYLEGCVNQPVGGWIEISSFAAISQQENMLDKLEAAKQLLTLSSSKEFIASLAADEKPGAEIEIEAGNAIFRELHKKLKERNILQTTWPGVPQGIAYEGTLENWLNENRIETAYNFVIEKVFSLRPEEVAEQIISSHHLKIWGESCFPDKLQELRENYKVIDSELKERWTELHDSGKAAEAEKVNEEIKSISNNLEIATNEEIRNLTFSTLESELNQATQISDVTVENDLNQNPNTLIASISSATAAATPDNSRTNNSR